MTCKYKKIKDIRLVKVNNNYIINFGGSVMSLPINIQGSRFQDDFMKCMIRVNIFFLEAQFNCIEKTKYACNIYYFTCTCQIITN